MTTSSGQPSRDVMEHARLVLNAIAQFEHLLEPVLDARSPTERKELSRVMIKWLADAPNHLLRAALLDQPCPAEFFERWMSADRIKMLPAALAVKCGSESGRWPERICLRPSDFSHALRAEKQS